MSILNFLLLIFCVVVMVIGQLIFKQVAINFNKSYEFLSAHIVGLVSLALTFYLVSTFVWVVVLRSVEISKAYPFFALGFVLVPVMGHLMFKEALNFVQIFGLALIFIGVILSGMGR